MAELTTIYFVVRPHGCVCTEWGNKTFKRGGEKINLIQEALAYCSSPSLPKGTNEKDKNTCAIEKHLEWKAKLYPAHSLMSVSLIST